MQGYVFGVHVTGLRRSGWEPNLWCFFLAHPACLGPWPVHDSKFAVWQLLLSVALGPAFCVSHPSHVSMRLVPPHRGMRMPGMEPTMEGTAQQDGLDQRSLAAILLRQQEAEDGSEASYLSSFDSEV